MSERETDPALLRSLHPGPLREESHLKGAGQVIGRDLEQVDLLLSGPEVSRRHAWIGLNEAGEWVIHDLDSLNGVFVNGQRIDHQRRLEPGDVIGLGRARAPDYEFTHAGAAHGRRLRLAGPGPWQLGRDLDCHISIPADLSVSQRHALLSRQDSGLLIRDAGSRNGLWQGEERLRRLRLHPDETVMLGHQRLTLLGIDAERVEVELRSLGGAIGLHARGLILPGLEHPRRLDLPAGQLHRLRLPSRAACETLMERLGRDGPTQSGDFGESWLDEQPARQRDRIALVGPSSLQSPLPSSRISLRRWLAEEIVLRLGEALPETARRELIHTTLEALDLVEAANRSLSQLSPLEQRLARLAAALLTRPGLLIVDAPSTGLKPGEAARIEARLERLAGNHLTIVLLSEDAGETPSEDDGPIRRPRLAAAPRQPSLAASACLLRRRWRGMKARPGALLEILALPLVLALALDLALDIRSASLAALAVLLISSPLSSLSLSAARMGLDRHQIRRFGLSRDAALSGLLLACTALLVQFLIVLSLATWRFPLDVWTVEAGLEVLLAGLAGLALGAVVQQALPARSWRALLLIGLLGGAQAGFLLAQASGPALPAALAGLWAFLLWLSRARD